MSRKQKRFLHEHSLSIVAISILASWTLLYSVSNPDTHLGSFFGNAIADWTGVVVMVLATKGLYEKDSAESKSPPTYGFGPIKRRIEEHSLTIFLVATGIVWVVFYASLDSESKWGQVVGNIVSEWVQMLGLVLLTKRLMERHSKEDKSGA